MKSSFLVMLLMITWSHIGFGQDLGAGKGKAYKAWVRSDHQPALTKGYLWQVRDSSLFIAASRYGVQAREYRFENLDLLKIRRENSIRRGAIIGSAIGVVAGIAVINSMGEDYSVLTVPINAFLSIVYGAIGAGIGSGLGMVKDRIPLRGKQANFDRYKGSLLKYSLQKEQMTAPEFIHRGYIGLETGISFAGGEFANRADIPVSGYSNMRKTGFVMLIQGGYRISRNFGINLASINSAYPVNSYQTSLPGADELEWDFTTLIISPVFSFPVSEKWRFDFSPGIGKGNTSLYNTEDYTLFDYKGSGFAYQVKGSFNYRYAKRWVASVSSGYLASKINYEEGGTGNAKSFNLTAGVAYQFGKKGL